MCTTPLKLCTLLLLKLAALVRLKVRFVSTHTTSLSHSILSLLESSVFCMHLVLLCITCYGKRLARAEHHPQMLAASLFQLWYVFLQFTVNQYFTLPNSSLQYCRKTLVNFVQNFRGMPAGQCNNVSRRYCTYSVIKLKRIVVY